MSMLVVGEPAEGKKKIWITARQHPGESMAEWFVEGLLDRLLDEDDGVARDLVAKSGVLRSTKYEPGWQRARSFTYQRCWCQFKPRMANTKHGKKP